MSLFSRMHVLRKMSLAYTLLIIMLVTLPINGEDQLFGSLNTTYVVQIRLDYLSHIALFFPWIVLGGYAWENHYWPTSKRWTVGILTLLFAALCEYIQMLLSYRSFNINDLIANSLGVLLGYLILSWLPPYSKAGN
jgi:glycopeptide antibiotics resistance protein